MSKPMQREPWILAFTLCNKVRASSTPDCLNYSWHILRLKKADSTKGNTTLSHLLISHLKTIFPLPWSILHENTHHASCHQHTVWPKTTGPRKQFLFNMIFYKIEMCKYRNSFYFWIYFPFLDFLLFSWLVSFEVEATYFLHEGQSNLSFHLLSKKGHIHDLLTIEEKNPFDLQDSLSFSRLVSFEEMTYSLVASARSNPTHCCSCSEKFFFF